MNIIRQVSVFLENRPGTLAEISKALAAGNINILGFTISDVTDLGVIRMILSDPIKAVHILTETGLLVVENDVITLGISNQPGALAELSEKLGAAGINIDYAWGGCGSGDDKVTLYVKVTPLEGALEVLEA